MTSQLPRNILELIRGTGPRRMSSNADRRFLLIEDLVDDPIEWTLQERPNPSTQQRSNQDTVFSLH